jgi:hypothetical protein
MAKFFEKAQSKTLKTWNSLQRSWRPKMKSPKIRLQSKDPKMKQTQYKMAESFKMKIGLSKGS